MSDRADGTFHHPRNRERLSLLKKSNFVVRNLGNVIDEIRYGTGSPPQYLDESEKTVPFIRATDIKEGEVNLETLFHVSAEQPSGMNKCRLTGGELIIVRSGANTGDCAVVPASLANAFAGYDLILTVKSDVSAKFLSNFLDTEIGRLQLNAVKGRSAQPHINVEEVSALQVPLPPITEQEKLVADMDAARAERKAKLAQADALLAGIDDFVLDALGIAPPQKETPRSFAVRPSQVGGEKRLNAEYYHPERTTALSALQATPENLTSRRLMEVVSFEREQLKTPGENYLSLAHVQGNTGELTDATDTASGNCLAFQTDDVLFARLRPYLNKVYRAEMNGCCSTEFQVLRVKDRKSLLPEYLAAILRSRIALAQTVHMMTGNTHPRLTNYDVATLAIPIPSMDVQNVIAAEVKRRRDEARRLRAEAEAGWDAAKARFEAQLLG